MSEIFQDTFLFCETRTQPLATNCDGYWRRCAGDTWLLALEIIDVIIKIFSFMDL